VEHQRSEQKEVIFTSKVIVGVFSPTIKFEGDQSEVIEKKISCARRYDDCMLV